MTTTIESATISDIKFTPVNITLPKPKHIPTLPYNTTVTRYSDSFYYYKNDTIIGKSLQHYGEYTELEIQLLKLFLKKDSVVYDIGANIGYHTVAFAKLADTVYAFEPNRKHLDLLYKNITKQKNVTVYDVAVSSIKGVVTIQDFDTDIPGNYGELYCNRDGYSVDCVKIDDLEIYRPTLVKIDVEGFEYPVLLGMTETIKEYKPVIFYEAHGNDLDLIYTYLKDMGYDLYWYPCPNYNPYNYKNNTVNVFGNGGVLNILATHNLPTTDRLIDVRKNETFVQAVERYNAQHI